LESSSTRSTGIKFYEKYALPVAIGYIVGTGFGGFILLTIHALR